MIAIFVSCVHKSINTTSFLWSCAEKKGNWDFLLIFFYTEPNFRIFWEGLLENEKKNSGSLIFETSICTPTWHTTLFPIFFYEGFSENGGKRWLWKPSSAFQSLKIEVHTFSPAGASSNWGLHLIEWTLLKLSGGKIFLFRRSFCYTHAWLRNLPWRDLTKELGPTLR